MAGLHLNDEQVTCQEAQLEVLDCPLFLALQPIAKTPSGHSENQCLLSKVLVFTLNIYFLFIIVVGLLKYLLE